MTGETLLAELMKLTPQQLQLPVLKRAEDVGRWRQTVCFGTTEITLEAITQEGRVDDNKTKTPNSIVL